MAQENGGTRVANQCIHFISGGKSYNFTIDEQLSADGRPKRVLIGRFISRGDEFQCNETAPIGVELDKQYCLKAARVYFPLGATSHPQDRQFWDFFPFKGDNLREVVALNDDAAEMSQMLKEGTLDPLSGNDAYVFNCMVLEPVYQPFNIEQFRTNHEKIDCLLQVVAGLKQLMAEETLQRMKIVAHRDLKFNNVVMEKLGDSYRLRIIDFPSVKFAPRSGEQTEDHTCMGFFSYCNTAPEDVLSKYTVSGKTDVFALGTMLAELFGVWNYGGMRNPLKMLFKLANNINGLDTQACHDFYAGLDKRFAQEDKIDNPTWLETVLASHEKNASWEHVRRVSSDLPMLFRAATMLNPQRRISLRDFERALRQIYNRLPAETVQSAANTPVERMTYFLVDTTDLDVCRRIYIDAVERVMATSPSTRIGLMSYGCQEAKTPQMPDPSPLSFSPLVVNEALSEIRNLPSRSRGAADLSGLKGSLYDLSTYLGNASNRQGFNGEIHIFAPETPNEKNTCYFAVTTTGEGGAPTMSARTGREIAETFGENVRIYVHTFREDDSMDTPHWYTPVYFAQEKPVVQGAAPAPAREEQPQVESRTPVAKREYKKGIGFHFIGGIPVER